MLFIIIWPSESIAILSDVEKQKITVFYIHKTLTHILDLFVIEIFNLVIRTVNILY